MISPIQSFDVNAIQAGLQNGAQRGAVNSPFTPLGQALKSTLDRYQSTLASQQEQQNALALVDRKGLNDRNVANTTGNRALEVEKYKREAYAPSPEDAAMYRDMQLNPDKYLKNAGDVKMGPHVKFVNGQPIGVDYRDVRSAGAFDYNSGEDGGVVVDDAEKPMFPFFGGGAKPRVPSTMGQGSARIPVQGPDGKKYSLPETQLDEALKQGYKRI